MLHSGRLCICRKYGWQQAAIESVHSALLVFPHHLRNYLMAGMQADAPAQLRALRTLAGMAKQRASTVPVQEVQDACRHLGLLEPLLRLLKDTMPCPQVLALACSRLNLY